MMIYYHLLPWSALTGPLLNATETHRGLAHEQRISERFRRLRMLSSDCNGTYANGRASRLIRRLFGWFLGAREIRTLNVKEPQWRKFACLRDSWVGTWLRNASYILSQLSERMVSTRIWCNAKNGTMEDGNSCSTGHCNSCCATWEENDISIPMSSTYHPSHPIPLSPPHLLLPIFSSLLFLPLHILLKLLRVPLLAPSLFLPTI